MTDFQTPTTLKRKFWERHGVTNVIPADPRSYANAAARGGCLPRKAVQSKLCMSRNSVSASTLKTDPNTPAKCG